MRVNIYWPSVSTRRLLSAIVLLLALLGSLDAKSQSAPPPDSIVLKPALVYRPQCTGGCDPFHMTLFEQFWYNAGDWHVTAESALHEIASQNFKPHYERVSGSSTFVSEATNLRMGGTSPESFWAFLHGLDGGGPRVKYINVLYDVQTYTRYSDGIVSHGAPSTGHGYRIEVRPICPPGFVHDNDPNGPQQLPPDPPGGYHVGYPNAGLCFRKLEDQLGDYCPTTVGSNTLEIESKSTSRYRIDRSGMIDELDKSVSARPREARAHESEAST